MKAKSPAVVMLAVLVSAALVEVCSYIGIAALNMRLSEPIVRRTSLVQSHRAGVEALLEGRIGRERLDATYGWTYRRPYASGPDTINEAGLRASRSHGSISSDSVRIAAFGDSFVYCNEVSNADCWTARLEEGWHAEVLNFGVGGWGTDQAFLRYLAEGRTVSPDMVIIGFAPTDLRRVVNRYRGFISASEGPWFKPRFRLADGALTLVNSPIRTNADLEAVLTGDLEWSAIGIDDYWYEPIPYEHALYSLSATYRLMSQLMIRTRRRAWGSERLLEGGRFRPASEAFALQLAIMSAFADSVRAADAHPVIVTLPSRADVAGAATGGSITYTPLVDSLVARGFDVVDPVSDLSRHRTIDALFAPGGHYSAEGNRIVANAIADQLELLSRPAPGG